MSVNWSDYISSPSQLTSDPATFFAAAVADDGVAILDQDMELAAAADSYTLSGGNQLTIRSPLDGVRRSIRLTGNVNGLTFDGETIRSTTLAARPTIGSKVISVASVQDVQVGDYAVVSADLSIRRIGAFPDYQYDQIDMGFGGTVVSVGVNQVTLDTPVRWAFEPNLELTFVAQAGQTRVAYGAVRISSSNIEVFLNDVQQTAGVDFNFTGPTGKDPDTAPVGEGVWIDFVSALSANDQVRCRTNFNVPVVFKRSGQLIIEEVALVGDDTDHPQKNIITDFTDGAIFREIDMEGQNTTFAGGYPEFGGVQFLQLRGVNTVVERFHMTGGGYGFFPAGHNLTIRNGVIDKCYNPAQLWFSGSHLTLESVTFNDCTNAIGGHGGNNITCRNLVGRNTSLYIRSNVVNIDGLDWEGKTNSTTISLGYGNLPPSDMTELLNSSDNPVNQAASTGFDTKCSLKNARISIPSGTLEILCLHSESLTLTNVSARAATVTLDGGASLPFRITSLTVQDCDFGDCAFRLVQGLTATGMRVFGALNLTAFTGELDTVSLTDCYVDATGSGFTAPINDASATASLMSRIITNCAFFQPGATRLTTNTDTGVEALYTLTKVRLNDVPISDAQGTRFAPSQATPKRLSRSRRQAFRRRMT